MTEFAATRFPILAPQDQAQAKGPRNRDALGLSLSLLPLPLGEISVLLTAWLLILQV